MKLYSRILITISLLISTSLFTLLYAQELTPPTFSVNSGFYSNTIQVSLSHPDPDATILYTLDGSEPTIENINGEVWTYKKTYPTHPTDSYGALIEDTLWTFIYTNELEIDDRSQLQDKYADISSSYFSNDWYADTSQFVSQQVFKGTVIRAVAYKNNIYSEIVTNNYLISPLAEDRFSIPVVCLTIDPIKFFSYDEGIYVPGKTFDDWRTDFPSTWINHIYSGLWTPANFRVKGKDSEIEINFSYFENGQEILNHEAGIRIHGSGSRVYPNKSLRLYARSEYGESNFNHTFMPNYSENKFKRLILRNSGQDSQSTILRDATLQQASKKLNIDIQEYQPVIVMINGEYFGIHNLRERIDDKYFKQKFNLEEDDMDYLKDGEVKIGDSLNYLSLINFIENNSLVDSANFAQLQKSISMKSFADYFITGIFVGNYDWPNHNTNLWRKRVAYDSLAEYGHDGRWRWAIQDLDLSFGFRPDYKDYTHDDLNFLTTFSGHSSIDSSTYMLRKLLENVSFKHHFINRFCDIINTSYKTSVLSTHILSAKNIIEGEIEEHTTRWNPNNDSLTIYRPVFSITKWEEEVNQMLTFATERQTWIQSHLQSRFTAGEVYEVTLDVSNFDHGWVKINTIDIDEETDGITPGVPYSWKGEYFENVPIQLTAYAKPGYKFSHWSGEISDTVDYITHNIAGDFYLKANFVEEGASSGLNEQNTMHLEVKVYPNPFTDEIHVLADQYNGSYTVYSLQGQAIINAQFNSSTINLKNLPQGMYILSIDTNEGSARKRILKN